LGSVILADRDSVDFHKLYAYCVRDVRSEMEASTRLVDLTPREHRIWTADQLINLRGMYINLPAVKDCLAIVEQASERYNAELFCWTAGHVKKSSEVAATIRWLASRGLYLENLDEETVYEQLDRKDLPKDIMRVIRIRQLLAFGSVKKLYAMLSQTASDGRLRSQYAYHGAHTSLWNGQNVQMANLYSGKFKTPAEVNAALACIATRDLRMVETCYGDAMELVADCLRSMVCAAPGHDLISADYSAIQAVVLACMAGEPWQIEVFHTHGKYYEATAAGITGKTLQFYIDYAKELGKHHSDRQVFGKIPGLGSGFGGWIGAYIRFGALDHMAEEDIKPTILKWRRANPWIVEFWGGQTRNKFNRNVNGDWDPERAELYGLEGCAVAAIENPGQCFAYRGVRYMVMHDTLYCQPPTDGAPLQYHEPRLRESERPYASAWEKEITYTGWNSNAKKGASGWQPMKLYGGVLTQNVIAKVSREFQANAMVDCEAAGYGWVMHTHDEGVAEVPKGWGSTKEYLEIVNRKPEWARHFDGAYAGQYWPVKAPDAWRAPFYGKWESKKWTEAEGFISESVN
jgi:DNA polymerase bacteriophage-type